MSDNDTLADAARQAPLTPSEIAEGRAMGEAATRLPWAVSKQKARRITSLGVIICNAVLRNQGGPKHKAFLKDEHEAEANAALITTAVNAFPRLLDAAERLAEINYRERVASVSERILADMQKAARHRGWAVAVHGSMSRDLDIVAVPWTDDASDETAFVEAMRASVAGTLAGKCFVLERQGRPWPGEPAQKPHGRRSWTLHAVSDQLVESEMGAHPYIDLCVMDQRAGDAAERLAEVEAERDRLREALRPFAHYAEIFDDEDDCSDCPDDYAISRASNRDEPTIGACRRARAALATDHAEGER